MATLTSKISRQVIKIFSRHVRLSTVGLHLYYGRHNFFNSSYRFVPDALKLLLFANYNNNIKCENVRMRKAFPQLRTYNYPNFKTNKIKL